MKLPIDSLLPAIRSALHDQTGLVIEAPPGAGKTTRVPLALLDEPWLAGSRILMLEPRRLATRAAASWMAHSLGESVGETVGYRMRMDTRTGPRTRLEVVTEGVLTRMLQHDPALEGIGAILFDEFHERSLHADTGLALSLQSRFLLRPDLRIVIMSATLDGLPVASLLGDAPILRSQGAIHPVETIHVPRDRHTRVEDAAATAIRAALAAHDGDILVFLPGTAEIRATGRRLEVGDGIEIHALHGGLSAERQQRAIEPAPPGRRKIVLATAIAETSLTIEDVRVVIDAGLMRVPRFSPRTGMTRLETLRVTRDAADQRRGRAGRTAPGVCYRLWSTAVDAGLIPARTPEIAEADLAPLALELAAWGAAPEELRWLDPPPAAAFAQAREVLASLGAIDDDGRITDHGRDLADWPAHPRVAHMILRANAIGAGDTACDIAALIEDRDLLRSDEGIPDPDLHIRLDILRRADRDGLRAAPRYAGPAHVDRAALARVHAAARQWKRRLRSRDRRTTTAPVTAGLVLAFAYPDRIAQRRPAARGRFLLRNGAGARIAPAHPLAAEDFIVAASLGGRGTEKSVFLAAPLERDDLELHFADRIASSVDIEWVPATSSVRALRRSRLGAIVLSETGVKEPPPERVTTALLDAVRTAGLDALQWTESSISIRQRLRFLHTVDPSWPDSSDISLLESLDEWLAPWLTAGSTSLEHIDLGQALLSRLDPRRRGRFDTLAPSHFEVPSGSRIRIDYSDPEAPALPVRLQEVFGLRETPRIADGTVPLTMRLLSPAMRPVQVTRDLASFWRNGYFDVRKDLRGRYPRHYWPDDPLTAQATRRTRPR